MDLEPIWYTFSRKIAVLYLAVLWSKLLLMGLMLHISKLRHFKIG